MTPQHHLPADIERTSMGIITSELAARACGSARKRRRGQAGYSHDSGF